MSLRKAEETFNRSVTSVENLLIIFVIGGGIYLALNPDKLVQLVAWLTSQAAKGAGDIAKGFIDTFQGSLRAKPTQTNPYTPEELRYIPTDVLTIENPSPGMYLQGSGTRRR